MLYEETGLRFFFALPHATVHLALLEVESLTVRHSNSDLTLSRLHKVAAQTFFQRKVLDRSDLVRIFLVISYLGTF